MIITRTVTHVIRNLYACVFLNIAREKLSWDLQAVVQERQFNYDTVPFTQSKDLQIQA